MLFTLLGAPSSTPSPPLASLLHMDSSSRQPLPAASSSLNEAGFVYSEASSTPSLWSAPHAAS